MLFRRLLLRIYHRAHRDHREAFLNPLSVISVRSVVDFAFCRSKLQRELLRVPLFFDQVCKLPLLIASVRLEHNGLILAVI